MKKFFYLITFLLFTVVLYGFLVSGDNDRKTDAAYQNTNSIAIAPGTNQSDTTTPPNFPYPEIFNFYYGNISGMNGGTVGALYLFGKYYFNCWNSTTCYIYDSTGTNGRPGVQRQLTYTGQCRDLATDGRYIYTGKASTILYKLDTNMAIISQFPMGTNVRACAYDPGRHAFWVDDWQTPIVCKDTAGVTKGTITNTLTAKYGLAFDSVEATDTGFVWCWDQGPSSAGPNALYKFRATDGTQLASYMFTNLPGNPDIAGGTEICIYPGTPSRKVLLLNCQNTALLAYKMSDILVYIESHQKMIENFNLSQNYPNPFNPTTQISYFLMKMTQVNLSVYDVLGNKVKTIVDKVEQAGQHDVTFNASSLSSGVYFYRITAGDFKDTKKMLLVK
jgi:hypothetical protein